MRLRALIVVLLLAVPGVARAGEWAALLIDMQPGFANVNHALTDAQKARVIRPQAFVLRSLSERGIPVAVMEYRGAWGRTNQVLLDAIGTGTHSIILKPGNSAFSAPELEPQLAAWGARRLIVMGANRGYCVLESVRSAAAKGFEVHVPDRLVEEYNHGDRGRTVAAARAVRPELQRLARVYDRTNDLLRQLPGGGVANTNSRRLR